ncbi:MAG TPA: histidinol-phosphatase [Chryseosolibacter sp.]|nr:histidinol-phosphatase [Chryseosolibacter sp.]
MWSNYHSHNLYCDGKSTLPEYLDEARATGVASLGFSSHAPLPFPCKWCMREDKLRSYIREIDKLKRAANGIEIYKGLEIDFVPGVVSARDFVAMLDYTIGSIHFVDAYEGTRWEIDNTLGVFKTGLDKIFQNNIRAAVTRYYELTRQMITAAPPHIVGHLDKIKMHNQQEALFEESESWYKNEVDKTLQAIKHANVIVEVNTRGLYKKKTVNTYPSPWILERVCEAHIPITLSSDAHHRSELICEFEPTATHLRDIGFKKLSILNHGIWKQVPFTENGLEL